MSFFNNLFKSIPAVAALLCLCAASPAQNIDLATTQPATVAVTYTGNYPNSVNTRFVSPAGDFNGDGIDDVIFGDPLSRANDGDGAFLVLGIAGPQTDLDFSIFDSDNSRGFHAYSQLQNHTVGMCVSPAGDFNGDGYDDILLGSWENEAYILFGHPSPQQNIDLATLDAPTTRGIKISGGGFFVSAAGDFNSDGCGDVMMTAPADLNNYPTINNVCVVLGRRTGLANINLATMTASDTTGFRIAAVTNYPIDELRSSPAAAGDFNGDGFDDILIEGEGICPCLIFGKANGLTDISIGGSESPENAIYICGPDYYQTFAGPADYNGDGLSDLLLSMGSSEIAFVIYGRTSISEMINVDDFSTTNTGGYRIHLTPGEGMGFIIGDAGDINGDGYSDILLPAPQAFHNGVMAAYGPSGSTYVIYGRPGVRSNIDLATTSFPSDDGFRVDGSGRRIVEHLASSAGDINNDGYDDFVIEEVISDESGLNHIIFGKPAWKTSVESWSLY